MPAAEPLVGGDAVGKHLFVDSGKEGLLGARDLGGRRLIQVGPGLAIGADEGLGPVRLQPLAGGCQAGEAAGADLPADLRHDMADAVGLRSEEHTSELQSLMRISYAVFCLQKKKTT